MSWAAIGMWRGVGGRMRPESMCRDFSVGGSAMAENLRATDPVRDRPEPVEDRDRVELDALEQIICRDAADAPARYIARADVIEDGE